MEKLNKKSKRIIHSVSFEEDTYKALKQAAELEGVSFAVYLKSAALNFTKAAIQHEQMLGSINPEDRSSAQKTFNDAINDLSEVLNRTLVNGSTSTNTRLDRIERLIRKMIYVQLYYAREIVPDQKSAAQISAKSRMEKLLKDIDTEPIEG